MKTKELKNLAKKIANAEYIIQTNSDPKARARAEDDIMELSGKATSVEDMLKIDEMVQDFLSDLLNETT